MKCFYHEEKDSVYLCEECKKALCEACMEEKKANMYCDDCIEKIRKKALKPAENVNVNYNPFWGFVFSLMPGAGQMYLGIMNRGMQLMITFLLGIFYIAEFNYGAGIFGALVGVIWFYSFFDYLFIRRKIDSGDIIFDEHIYPIKTKKIEIKYLGIGLVILGIWLIFTSILDYTGKSYQARQLVYDMFIPLLMVGGGAVLLIKNKKKIETKEDVEV